YFYQVAVGKTSGVSFVCINVHIQYEVTAYPNQYVAEDNTADAVYHNRNDVFVFYAKTLCSGFVHMNMSVSDNGSFLKLNAALRASDLDRRRAFEGTRIPHRRIDT